MLDGGGKEMVKNLCTFNRRGRTNHRQKHQVCYEKQLAYMKAEQSSVLRKKEASIYSIIC